MKNYYKHFSLLLLLAIGFFLFPRKKDQVYKFRRFSDNTFDFLITDSGKFTKDTIVFLPGTGKIRIDSVLSYTKRKVDIDYYSEGTKVVVFRQKSERDWGLKVGENIRSSSDAIITAGKIHHIQ